MSTLITIALAPIVAAILFGVIGPAIRLLIARHMPPCWIKDQVLVQRFKGRYIGAERRIREEALKRALRKS